MRQLQRLLRGLPYGAIDVALRPLLGNRIFGCDDCQRVCPWNKYAQRSTLADFDVREPLGHATLLQLWDWDEATFLRRTEGSAIRRIGHVRWQRNIAVALGNAWRETGDPAIAAALAAALPAAAPLVAEHIVWALAQRAADQAIHDLHNPSHSGSATIPINVDTVTSPAA